MSPPSESCDVSSDSAARSHCCYGYASSVRRKNRSRSAFFSIPFSTLLAPYLSFIAFKSATTVFAFMLAAFLFSCAWIALSIFATILPLILAQRRKHCGRNAQCSAGTWRSEILHPRPHLA